MAKSMSHSPLQVAGNRESDKLMRLSHGCYKSGRTRHPAHLRTQPWYKLLYRGPIINSIMASSSRVLQAACGTANPAHLPGRERKCLAGRPNANTPILHARQRTQCSMLMSGEDQMLVHLLATSFSHAWLQEALERPAEVVLYKPTCSRGLRHQSSRRGQ